MVKTKISTADKIRETLSGISRPTFLSLLAVTEPKLRKGCPALGVRKISKILGIANFRYENSVNSQREREGKPANFESLPRTWGERILGCPLVAHKGEFYLEVKVERVLKSARYVDGQGRFISRDIIAPYLPPSRDSGRQGTEKAVILRDYKLSSIRNLRIGGRELV